MTTSRIPTLVLYAKSQPHWRRVCADTFVGALGLTPERLPGGWLASRRVRFLFAEEYRSLSYMVDWREALGRHPELDVAWCNVNNLLELRAAAGKLKTHPLAIVLHSAAGDNLSVLRWIQGALQDRRGVLVVFFGNEYNRMPHKIGFARAVGADYIASQLPLPAAEWLYAGCGATVLPLPAALNPALYRPGNGARPVDVGFRGDIYEHAYSLGDVERTELLRSAAERATGRGLACDIQYVRAPREEWSRFLATCKGVVGAESGTYYLERDDRTQEAVKAYLAQHPDATFGDVRERFFKHYPDPVSGKAVSSRHFEPVGTKTCQVLLEGGYNGLLKADEHYIAVRKDGSNLDDALQRLTDEAYRRAMVNRTYDYVMALHTYRHRVDALLCAIRAGRARAACGTP
jgi:hypothetical protein